VPSGGPGELYIGGDGVARGYWKRPELTAERFLIDPFVEPTGAAGERLYRTGDKVRSRADGSLEFMGRLDQQVKLRGYRIELGEIEAGMVAHPWVREGAVAIRPGPGGTDRLVGYVVTDPEGANADGAHEPYEQDVVGQWSTVWDTHYGDGNGAPAAEDDPTFNIRGWNSSYTAEAIPAEEMREWVDETVARLRRGDPQRILEIGCGTGLLLFQAARHAREYMASDISPVALAHIERHLDDELRSKVTLHCRRAEDFEGVEPHAFDLVVLNSVVQYFPSLTYLRQVLEGAAKCVAPGGRIVIGDVRNLRLLEAFQASVAAYRAPSDTTVDELRREVEKRVSQEEELVIDPDFFLTLSGEGLGIRHVEIEPKTGASRNEMNRFRYDVTLHIDGDAASPADTTEVTWLDWAGESLTLEALGARLDRLPSAGLGVRGIKNPQTVRACALVARLHHAEDGGQDVEGLERELGALEPGVDASQLVALANGRKCRVYLSWARGAEDGAIDALFLPSECAARFPMPATDATGPRSWTSFGNQPILAKMARQLTPKLREALSTTLPDYMIPSVFVTLDTLPLTPNKKVDRNALPDPEEGQSGHAEWTAPETPTEEMLASLWEDVLGIERVGARDNFFALGGHSLLATQLIARIRSAFQVSVGLLDLFKAPTLGGLAALVEERVLDDIEKLSEDDVMSRLSEGADRAATSKEAPRA